ncbi:MAG: hypothetical protein JJ863_16230 [Deltaproteobacteria bacterium]|nr:hypothetical protein [Deltaproteobacteria bacterium]
MDLLDLPILALPWRGTAQTHIETGAQHDAVQLDYEVWPEPHVDRLLIAPDFDRLLPIDPMDSEERCPSTIDLARLRDQVVAAGPAGGEVVRALVIAEGSDRARRGELFFSTGESSIRVGLPPEAETEGESLLLFEPAWGEPRVALRVVEPGETGEVALEGLPEGPGTVVWLRPSGPLVRDVESSVVYLPGGFAQDWVAFADEFWTASVRQLADGTTLALERGVRDFESLVLRDDLEWDVGAEDAPANFVVLGADAAGAPLGENRMEGTSAESYAQGDVRIPCGTPLTVWSPSFARVFVSQSDPARGGAEDEVVFGAQLEVEVACELEEEWGRIWIRVDSRNARDVRVVLSSTEVSS